RRSPKARRRAWPGIRRSSPLTWGYPRMLLELENVHLAYGRIEALHGISLQVDEGEIVALIGANGAGKTSTMRAISGLHGVSQGRIRFAGKDITLVPAHERVRQGLCLAPEGRGIFP